MEALQEAYPHVGQALPRVTKLLQTAACGSGTRSTDGAVVVEFWLGEPGGTATPEVGLDHVARILCLVETSDAWREKVEWTEEVRRQYTYTLPGQGPVTFVTTTCPSPSPCRPASTRADDGLYGNVAWTTSSSEVEAVPLVASAAAVGADTSVGMTPCGHVKSERRRVWNPADLPDRVDSVEFIQIRHVRTFVYESVLSTAAKWHIKVAQVYEGESYHDVLVKLRHGALTRHEVWIECHNLDSHLAAANGSIAYVAASLLLKAADLVHLRNHSTLTPPFDPLYASHTSKMDC